METKCDDMMFQLQQYYRKRAHVSQKVPIGALVLVRHHVDQVVKRARIIDYNEARQKYRVLFIDYGQRVICQQHDIFEMERSFTRLPAMAICCTLDDIILKKPEQEIQNQVFAILGTGPDVECQFNRRIQNKTVVEMNVNGCNIKDTMIRDNLLINLPKGTSYLLSFKWYWLFEILIDVFSKHFPCRYLLRTLDWSNSHGIHHCNQGSDMFSSAILWL